MLLYHITFLLLISSKCSEAQLQRIKNAKIAKDGEAPYAVALRKPSNPEYMCGGTILNDRYILTAAHCIDLGNGSESSYVVISGTNNYRQPGVTHYLEKIILHCNFQNPKENHNDIALLRLNATIKWNYKTLPIEIRYEPLLDGEPLTLYGWGKSEMDLREPTQNLRKLTLWHVPFSKCRSQVDDVWLLAKLYIGHICAYSNYGGACKGDSGSPLVDSKKRLVGMANLINDACYGTSAFASMKYHIDWITIVSSENSGCTICNFNYRFMIDRM